MPFIVKNICYFQLKSTSCSKYLVPYPYWRNSKTTYRWPEQQKTRPAKFRPKQPSTMNAQNICCDASVDQGPDLFHDGSPGFEYPTWGGYPDIPFRWLNARKRISAISAWNGVRTHLRRRYNGKSKREEKKWKEIHIRVAAGGSPFQWYSPWSVLELHCSTFRIWFSCALIFRAWLLLLSEGKHYAVHRKKCTWGEKKKLKKKNQWSKFCI